MNYAGKNRWIFPHVCLTGVTCAEEPAARMKSYGNYRGLIEGEHYE